MKIHCAEYERARERKRKFTQINIKIKVKHIIYYSIRLWNRQQQRAFHSWEFYLAIKLKFLIMAKKKTTKNIWNLKISYFIQNSKSLFFFNYAYCYNRWAFDLIVARHTFFQYVWMRLIVNYFK